jgi:hypothetical protein
VVGSFSVDTPAEQDPYLEPVRNAVSSWLVEKRARTYTDENQIIRFKAGIFRFVTSLNILVQIRSGTIEVSPMNGAIFIAYRFLYTEMILAVAFLALLGRRSELLNASNVNKLDTVGEMVIIWLLLFVPNYLLSLFLVPARLKDVVQRAVQNYAP